MSAEETFQVRQPVLRPNRPLDTCKFDGDLLNTTFHFGLYLNEELLGVCSFFNNTYSGISSKNQYQLRGMAVLKTFQGQGLGKLILQYGENFMKEKGADTIWCNARQLAVPFYKKNNYAIISEPFNIEHIGLHYVMSKSL
ncbi:GNAT family N-acetyltransferase [Tamlana fucoidanivorans]|uniref:GNAT family N-acetyltransferase n=1 Tax=Allotamlana fucoidanivorans TaxID=2583814 RepID=UPI001E452062|nr:GNAT family N-acetyltransferase [Tamlana fucoidanivorans]